VDQSHGRRETFLHENILMIWWSYQRKKNLEKQMGA